MPISPIAGAIINTGITAGGNLLQNNSNRRAAKRQAQWNRENQQSQNKYNLQMWERANAYNTPKAQMGRFAEAGLNPHLIYGKGSNGNASALQSADVKPYSRSEARSITDGVDAFGDYNRFQNLQAQTDNLKQSSELSKQQQKLTALKAVSEAVGVKRSATAYGVESGIAKYSVDAAKINLEKLNQETSRATSEAYVSNKSKQSRVDQEAAKLRTEVAREKNIKADTAIKKFESSMNKAGLTRNDPLWARELKKFVEYMQQQDIDLSGFDRYKNLFNK